MVETDGSGRDTEVMDDVRERPFMIEEASSSSSESDSSSVMEPASDRSRSDAVSPAMEVSTLMGLYECQLTYSHEPLIII